MSPTDMADYLLQMLDSKTLYPAAFFVGVVVCLVGYLAFKQHAHGRAVADSVRAPVIEGTKFVEEEGHLVRRSTRAKKPVEFLNSVASPVRTPLKVKEVSADVAKVTPKASKVQLQSLKTPVSTTRTRSLAAAARESTPVVEAEEEQATPKTRKTRIGRV